MVDAIVSGVLEQLNSMMAQERQVMGVRKEMEKVASKLRAIQAAVVDAEQRQLKDEAVRAWLDRLKYASYDLEDALDEWKIARPKLQIEEVRSKVNPICFCCSLISVQEYVSPRKASDIVLKIKDINENLDDIAPKNYMLDFNENFNMRIYKPQPLQSIFFVDEEIIGRDEEENALISSLVCESSIKRKGLHIISLVGWGGIGKTTLAKLVYNHDDIKKNFEKRIWVCVSDPFDEIRIARAIIEALTGSSTSLVEFEALMQTIHAFITEKKFLLVLDDVWTDDYTIWEPFYHCLKSGLYGSKILVTTRKETVARMMKSDIFLIRQLSEEECLLLFKRTALSGRSNEEWEILAKIGQEIAGKCKGLPLAVKIIGSLLHFKRTEEEWRSILDSEMWELDEPTFGPLLLSYNDLPSVIKRCLSFCAVFPKDCDIGKDKLIQLWMALGYLSGQQNEEIEIIGAEYFQYLASRSFFQELEIDDNGMVKRCKLHGIIHDFAQFVSKKEVFTAERNGREDLFINSFDEKVYHSTFILGEGASLPVSICDAKRLRSLFVHGKHANYPLVSEVLPKLFRELKCLRALDVHGEFGCYNLIKVIPKEIGKLMHLRYLNLSGQEIDRLPDTLCELYNLQTLDITLCRYLKELPDGIGKLETLRHLINYGTRSLSYLPVGIERLTNLRTLKSFVVDGGGHGSKACGLESLKCLNLFGDCQIRGLGNVSDVDEAERLQLQNMKNLVELYLGFNKNREVQRMENEDEALLKCLQPPPSLKRLTINDYRGNTFSTRWTMSLNHLKYLLLHDCLNCKHLPPLGKLFSLEGLGIWGLTRVRRVGNEFLGIESYNGSSSSSSIVSFPKLKWLEIGFMGELEEWEWDYGSRSRGVEDITIMPLLSSLEICYCPNLMALPESLLQTTTLQELTISGCPILGEHYIKGTGKYWSKISHIPKITVNICKEAVRGSSETQESTLSKDDRRPTTYRQNNVPSKVSFSPTNSSVFPARKERGGRYGETKKPGVGIEVSMAVKKNLLDEIFTQLISGFVPHCLRGKHVENDGTSTANWEI